MPIACSQTVLTGQDGAIYFQPAATEFCLEDYVDFPAGDDITVPEGHDFRIGDPVRFKKEGSPTLDSALSENTTYYVLARTKTTIQVGTSSSMTSLVTLNGDGGLNNTAGGNLAQNTAGAANHILIDYSEFDAVCQVKSFSLDLSREEIDTTTLPCGVGGSGGDSNMAPFRTMQAGYASGSGSMEVQFTTEQSSLANRLLANSMRKNQSGAEVRLFINTVEGTGLGAGQPDLSKSLYIQAPISILGFSLSVSPEEVITASLNFSLSGQPSKLFV